MLQIKKILIKDDTEVFGTTSIAPWKVEIQEVTTFLALEQAVTDGLIKTEMLQLHLDAAIDIIEHYLQLQLRLCKIIICVSKNACKVPYSTAHEKALCLEHPWPITPVIEITSSSNVKYTTEHFTLQEATSTLTYIAGYQNIDALTKLVILQVTAQLFSGKEEKGTELVRILKLLDGMKLQRGVC